MNWIDTNTLITICTCAIGLAQFFFWRYIANQKSYESEVGKLNAQIEKMEKITDVIKSVESKYNNSFEQYRFELQKDFESSKYIINLCNSLDAELLKHMAECGKMITLDDDKGLTDAAVKLHIFISTYKYRYLSNSRLKELYMQTKKIKDAFLISGKLYQLPNIERIGMVYTVSNAFELFIYPLGDKKAE